MRHSLGMTNRVSDGDSASLRNSQDGKTADAYRCHDTRQVLNECFECEVFDVPIREPISSFVVSNQEMISGKLLNYVPPDRTLPIELKVVKPIGRFDQWWPIADGSVS